MKLDIGALVLALGLTIHTTTTAAPAELHTNFMNKTIGTKPALGWNSWVNHPLFLTNPLN
jgi:hypothetical protein